MSFNQGIAKARSTTRPDLTVKQLKDLCRAQQKSTAGNKDELFARVYDDDAPKYQGPGRPKVSQDTAQRDMMKDFKKRAPSTPSDNDVQKFPFMLDDKQMREMNVTYTGTVVGHKNKTLYCYKKNKGKSAGKPADKAAKSKNPSDEKSLLQLIAQGYTREAACKKVSQMHKKQESTLKSPKAVASPVDMLATTNDKKRARDESDSDSECESMFDEEEMTVLDRNVARFHPQQLKNMIKHLKSGDSPKVHETDWKLVREFNELITETNDDDKSDNDSQVQSDEDDDEEDADFEEEEEEESGSESGADSDDEADDM